MTYTKEEARIKIQKLVEGFHAHEATLEKAAEAQIENNFIRPLFRYLNWNTENEGLSHAHYEFKVQVTNKKGLRPDYILNVDGRDVLVMDAKQVKYSMKDPRWLYQVYSYAYSTQNSKPSAKMDFAILTDFQEFIVLDCTLFAAKPEAVNNFRVLDWTYKDYVEKFDELWELLERNNVLNNSLPPVIARSREAATTLAPHASAGEQSPSDKEIASGEEQERPRNDRGLWSRYLSPQKVKANRIPPDKAFLAEMDDEKTGWRVLLAKDMKKRNPSADGELITAAVQLLIDRLIFIKALSDREVDKDYLDELAKVVAENGLTDNDTGWFKACKTIFDELNNFYNGSIFQERRELENVTVSNKVVQSVITDLQPENSPYNFAVLPVEILGTIYERFLGRVVRTTDKRVTIEDKPEVRKAGGVYYTPQYIVDYIVENTLGKLLDPTPNPSPNEEHIRRGGLTPADVAKIKILDPACGSGSFLLGAYSKLIDWHKDYFERAGKEKRDRESFYKDESGGIRLTAKLKRDILKNNLFGVDIDPQAMEVTRFSLSLKALEDLREGELTEERSLFHQTVLPDLSANIKNGNSLIGTDYFAGKMFSDMEELKQVRPFDWSVEFPEIIKNGGFDVAIGNPPYVNAWELYDSMPNVREYINSSTQYKTASRHWDLYVLFLERALELIRASGYISFIIPFSYCIQKYANNSRELLLKETTIESIADIRQVRVFGDVPVITIIPVARKELPKPENGIQIRVPDNLSTKFVVNSFVDSHLVHQSSLLSRFETMFRLDMSEKAEKLIDKIDSASIPTGEICYVNYGAQLSSKEKGKFGKDRVISEKKTSPNHKPLVSGRNLYRYSVTWAGKYVDYSLAPEMYGARFPEFFEKIKLMFRDITGTTRLEIALDNDNFYCDHTILCAHRKCDIHPHREFSIDEQELSSQYELKYLLGILNSKLVSFYYNLVLTGEGIRIGGGFHTYPETIRKLPVFRRDQVERKNAERLIALVTQMLELHKSKAGAKTQSEGDVYERQIKAVDESIDQLVYELYGLSGEEIGIVEGR